MSFLIAWACPVVSCASGILAPDAAIAAESVKVRAALVDIGSREKMPEGFIDLLALELQGVGVALVEREQIDEALREQVRGLLTDDSEAAPRIGGVVAADALVIFEAGKPLGPDRPYRLRVIETRHGLKTLDTAGILGSDGALAKHARWEAARVHEKLRWLPLNVATIKSVAVSRFRSLEPSPRWDWISDVLGAGVEHRLSGQAGVMLLERQQTRQLIDERALTEGLPDAIKPSLVFVDGQFALDREAGPSVVRVTVRCRVQGGDAGEELITGTLDNVSALTDAMARFIERRAQLAEGSSPLGADIEAEILLREGRGFGRLSRYDLAIPPLRAASAIDPKRIEIAAELLGALRSDLTARQTRAKGTAVAPPTVSDLCAAAAQAHRVLYHPDFPRDRIGRRQAPGRYTILNDVWFVLRTPDLAYRHGWLRDESKESHIALRDALRPVWDKYSLRAGEADDDLYAQSLSLVAESYWWADSPEQYLAWVRQSLHESRQGFRFVESAKTDGLPFRFASHPLWADRTDFHALYAGFLVDLRMSEHPLDRLYALISLVQDAGTKPETRNQGMELYEEAAELLLGEALDRHPQIAAGVPALLLYTAARGRLVLTSSQVARIYTRAIERAYVPDPALAVSRSNAKAARPLVWMEWRDGTPQDIGTWPELIGRACGALEELGRVDEADTLLGSCIDAGKGQKPPEIAKTTAALSSARRELRTRHPTMFAGSGMPQVNLKPIATLRTSEAGESFAEGRRPVFRRVFMTGNGPAVLWAEGNSRDERVCLLRLDRDTMRSRHRQRLEERVTLIDTAANARLRYEKQGPAACVQGDAVVVGFPRGGLAWFDADGGTRRMTEESGLVSNDIKSIDAAGQKLFVVTESTSLDYGVMEVDPRQHVSRMLFSARGDKPKSALNGLAPHQIGSLAAHADGTRLLVFVGYPTDDIPRGPHLYEFDPNSGRTVETANEAAWATFWGHRENHFDDHSLETVSLQAAAKAALRALLHAEAPHDQPERLWNRYGSVERWEQVGDSIIVLYASKGGSPALYRYRRENQSAERLVVAGIADMSLIGDMTADDDYLYLMTPEMLVKVAP